ncbi:hypothetical protein Xazr_12315 [Xanthomonas campestris pv. azadirachtae]|nr:hypothetical protein Xazr_12315 [Xanthomonas campestris pv. azadirachtae]
MQLSSGLCALLMLVSAVAGATDLYKWKDAKGVTHYTETPPPTGQRYEARRIDALSGKGEVSMAAGADGKPGAVLDQDARATQRNLADAAVKAYCKPAAPGGPAT